MPEEDRDARTAIRVGRMLTKLAPAMRELDMQFDAASTLLPSDDPDAVLGKIVYRYR